MVVLSTRWGYYRPGHQLAWIEEIRWPVSSIPAQFQYWQGGSSDERASWLLERVVRWYISTRTEGLYSTLEWSEMIQSVTFSWVGSRNRNPARWSPRRGESENTVRPPYVYSETRPVLINLYSKPNSSVNDRIAFTWIQTSADWQLL